MGCGMLTKERLAEIQIRAVEATRPSQDMLDLLAEVERLKMEIANEGNAEGQARCWLRVYRLCFNLGMMQRGDPFGVTGCERVLQFIRFLDERGSEK